MRTNPYKSSAKGLEALNVLDAHASSVDLEPDLVELVRLRASQIEQSWVS